MCSTSMHVFGLKVCPVVVSLKQSYEILNWDNDEHFSDIKNKL